MRRVKTSQRALCALAAVAALAGVTPSYAQTQGMDRRDDRRDDRAGARAALAMAGSGLGGGPKSGQAKVGRPQ